MNELIAIVDDEKDIVNLVTIHAKKYGYKTVEFYDGTSLLKFLNKEKIKPDVLVLDLMLPDIDGFEICKIIKSDETLKRIPIIMLTAKQDESDKLIGLEIGAEDYVTKPFSPKELLARIKVIFRRNRKESDDEIKIINIGNMIRIDLQKYEVYDNDGNKIDLTTTEFKILNILAGKIGWVFSRDRLLDELWGIDKAIYNRTIDVHIKNLREKLGEFGKIIKSIRGVGYKIEI